MKNRFVALFCLLCSISMSFAQNVYEGQAALVYSMPKTVLVFEVEVEKQVQEPGPFYQYAKRFLGTSDVITERSESCKVVGVKVKTKTVADLSRQYVIPAKMSNLPSIQLTDKGILWAVNTVVDPEKKSHEKPMPTPPEKKHSTLIPWAEEHLQANSIAKMAEGVAQQIYRIRENRLSLLMGDVDLLPADGEALKQTIKRLDREERELCQLFVGKTNTVKETQIVEYTPYQSVENHVLFRISPSQGLVAASDLSGSPVYLNLQATLPDYLPETKQSAKQKEKTVFYYNYPGSAVISLTDGERTFLTKELVMPQFGISIPLPMSLFVKDSYQAVFNPKTGVLLQLTQSKEK